MKHLDIFDIFSIFQCLSSFAKGEKGVLRDTGLSGYKVLIKYELIRCINISIGPSKSNSYFLQILDFGATLLLAKQKLYH